MKQSKIKIKDRLLFHFKCGLITIMSDELLLDPRIKICDICRSPDDVKLETDTCNDLLIQLRCTNTSHAPISWITCKECSPNNISRDTLQFKYTLRDEWTRHLRLCHKSAEDILIFTQTRKFVLKERQQVYPSQE